MSSFNQVLIKKSTRHSKVRTCNVKSLRKCPQKAGTVVKVRIVKPKKPNSSQRKIVKVRTFKRNILAYIPGQGHNLKSFSCVLFSGGRANDLSGVRLSLLRGKLDFS